ncbi:MAG: hypothetical protein IT384_00955 [Deltaproteobacteria bacterium]|nr:hypothetical protein [Deltaproteobacteria bacterium]
MRRAGVIALAAALGSCGFDGFFLTPRGFDATPPPRVVLEGLADPGSVIEIWSRDRRVVATGEAAADGSFSVELPPALDGLNLELRARRGSRTVKRVVAEAPRGVFTPVGPLDARSTAAAQLAIYEVVAEAGSTMAATPPPALRGLLRQLEQAPTPELDALVAMIDQLLARMPLDGSAPALFTLGDFAVSEAALSAGGFDGAAAADYKTALARAAQGFGLEIRCDPTRLNALFSVDLSGRARDGNGAPQLIRQPPKEGKVFLGFTADESSPIADESIPRKLVPNDPSYLMTDDGRGGDEAGGDGVFSVVVPLPRGARLLYKYTDGSAGQGFTGTEEWPGNARILEVEDVLTGRPDGAPDCLIVRRDSFGDEASNKNFVNLNTVAEQRGGTVRFETDLGGADRPAAERGARLGGLGPTDLRIEPPLTPRGVPEARENGVCVVCPPPLILDPDDATPPALIGADRTAIDRVRVRFSEPLHPTDARDRARYQYLDDAGRNVPILDARPSGSEVLLQIAPSHPRAPATLSVRNLRDASAAGNVLEAAEAKVGADQTPPKVLALTARSLLDLDPTAQVADPTVGEVVEVVLDEIPEASAASDPARFVIEGLEVRASVSIDGAPAPTLRLITAPQEKGRVYSLVIRGLRDVAGNAIDQTLSFDAFGLYRVRFRAVPGFAYASSDGAQRGLPRGERLYLTGTPLLAARDLTGRDLSITARGGVRSDVTGWREFELKPSPEIFRSENGLEQPVFAVEVLLPKGSWAWKVAHGVEGEHVRPPPTLEKVMKVLATTNDPTGVRVDPAAMRAANGLDYSGARLSESGDDPPRRGVVFKREAPDEVCEVTRRDVECALIVVGTWRDLVLDPGGRTRDYDDGLLALPPHRPELPDFAPPRLLDARARDSYSVLVSFDEALAAPATPLEVELARAEDGVGLRVGVLDDAAIAPHQVVLRLDPMAGQALADGVAYTVRVRGATDRATPPHTDRRWRSVTVLAPDRNVPFRPLVDREAPRAVSVDATDLTELVVRFDERLDPVTVLPGAFAARHAGTNEALVIDAAELLPDRASVRLTTGTQRILEPYVLEIRGISDTADPANFRLPGPDSITFTGFGEREPPRLLRARAIAADRVLLRFDEPLDFATALDPARYQLQGLEVREVAFSGDPARRSLAFNARSAPRVREAVLLTTAPMNGGATYTVRVDGVRDLSGNAATASAEISGVTEPPQVDVVLELEVSDGVLIAGQVPSRAISLAELTEAREGIFVLGARAARDLWPEPGSSGPINEALKGFPAEGQPLDGLEPRLRDDGSVPDRVAGDGVFSILVPAVPLGTTMLWKAFAPFSTGYRDRNPTDDAAAFADALPGPSVFSDGQEFPGHENGAVILDEGAELGVVRVRALFGDEITYKKFSGQAAYLWVVHDAGP